MLLTLTLPRIGEQMTSGVIKTVHAAEGAALSVGGKLFDVIVDLSAIAPHDCPPISLYRIALREALWLRRLAVAARDEVPVGTPLALLTTTPDEPLDDPLPRPPARSPRVTIAGIVYEPEWWEGEG